MKVFLLFACKFQKLLYLCPVETYSWNCFQQIHILNNISVKVSYSRNAIHLLLTAVSFNNTHSRIFYFYITNENRKHKPSNPVLLPRRSPTRVLHRQSFITRLCPYNALPNVRHLAQLYAAMPRRQRLRSRRSLQRNRHPQQLCRNPHPLFV
nr:MAG TPA: hypothetical protein [Caudoviricetes sp.]